MRTSIPAGRRRVPDANLYLRESAAAITTAGEDRTSPDYASAYIDLGPGEYIGAVELVNAAVVIPNADNAVEIHVVGANAAETVRHTLATKLLGANEVLSDTADNDLSGTPNSIFFSTYDSGVIYPKVRLEVVSYGTTNSLSVNFDAFITRGPRS